MSKERVLSEKNVDVPKNAIVYHTPYYTLSGAYGVTIVAIPDNSGLILGFSICAPFDNFSRQIGRKKAYVKTFKDNFYREYNGVLNTEASYLSYSISNDVVTQFFYRNGKLSAGAVKSFLAEVGNKIVTELGKKRPNKAYPICQGVCGKIIDNYYKTEMFDIV